MLLLLPLPQPVSMASSTGDPESIISANGAAIREPRLNGLMSTAMARPTSFVTILLEDIGSDFKLKLENSKILARSRKDGAVIRDPTPNGPTLMAMARPI